MRASSMLAAVALALAGSGHSVHVSDGGPRGIEPIRVRRKPSVRRVSIQQSQDIVNWNAEVERKKAENRAAKRFKHTD